MPPVLIQPLQSQLGVRGPKIQLAKCSHLVFRNRKEMDLLEKSVRKSFQLEFGKTDVWDCSAAATKE